MKRKRRETEPQEQAIRLMEALSGVDEELLERCEENGIWAKAPVPLWRYAKSWAAVLCLAAVGLSPAAGLRNRAGLQRQV